jgi:hypothetical protein
MTKEALIQRLREEAAHDLHHETVALLEEAAQALAQPEQEDGCPVCGSDVHDRDALDKAEREIERLTAFVKPEPLQGPDDLTVWRSRALQAESVIDKFMAQPEQEPAALFKWLPEGATHIGRISVRTGSGGSLAMTSHAFKYDSEILKVYVTDNDNEYPGWRDAKDCFFHLNFPVLPLYTPPAAQRKPLTDEQIRQFMKSLGWTGEHPDDLAFARAVEAAHGIKENNT